jgi:hypothetical protein
MGRLKPATLNPWPGHALATWMNRGPVNKWHRIPLRKVSGDSPRCYASDGVEGGAQTRGG